LGRKVHPVGFRLGIIRDWSARWYADKKADYAGLLHEDIALRRLIEKELANASVSGIDIERSANRVTITVHTAKPGIVIGKGGTKVDELKGKLQSQTGKKVHLTIQEIRQPELDSYLVARNIAEQLERRVSYRRAMKQSVGRALKLGAKGIKIRLGGRLAGSEMARIEWERSGRIPLHTIRADIDYGQVHAYTTYGRIGVKVWIYKGDILPPPKKIPAPRRESAAEPVTTTT
jgi:small subunit ribosomal protein S3